MKIKKIFVILAFIFIVIIILMILSRDKANQKPEIDLNSSTPVVTSTIINQKKDFIRDFNWKNIGTTLPRIGSRGSSEIKEVGGIIRKYSANGKYSAFLSGQVLVIEDEVSKQIPIDLTPETEAVNFIWLNSDLLLLIEKEAAFRKIDRIFFIKADLGQKNFFAGSFPIKDRLNLAFEPVVFDDGSEVLFQDNARNYWQLSLIY